MMSDVKSRDQLGELRAVAEAALPETRLPTTREESWRFTPLGEFGKASFEVLPTRSPNVLLAQISRFIVPEAGGCRLVFVDGVHAPELSSFDCPPGAVVVATLSTAKPEWLTCLGSLAPPTTDYFAALNGCFAREGAVVILPPGEVRQTPIQLLFVASGEHGSLDGAPAIFPRCLIVAGANSEATIVQEFVCVREGSYMTNAVTEVVVGENASVRHVRVQSESRDALHVARTAVDIARDGRYSLQSIALGARLSRLEIDVRLSGEGASATLDGLALLAGRQEADTHSSIHHTLPNGQSRQLHKCVVGDEAHAVFNGKIRVARDAQHTDSAQSSRNLLLSEKARVDTKPELEIFADDVKCAHGAAIGQLDDEALFYLASRGLDEEAARDLLTYAFAAEVIDRVPVPSLRKQLQDVVVGRTDRTRRGV